MPFSALWGAVLNQHSTSCLPSHPETAWVSTSSSPERCLALVQLEHQQRRRGLSTGQQSAAGNPPLLAGCVLHLKLERIKNPALFPVCPRQRHFLSTGATAACLLIMSIWSKSSFW